MKAIIQTLRAQFRHEWTWRLFWVLQLSGVLGIVLLDAAQTSWDLLPRNKYGWHWDLFDVRYWDLSSSRVDRYANWIAAGMLFGPYAVVRATDWVIAGRRESR